MGKKTNAISTFLGSRSGQRFFNIAYSVGAAIVIIGAMFKILHLPLADYILGFAMVMEASVFLLSAFDPSIYDDEPTVITQSVQSGNQAQVSGIHIKSTTEPDKAATGKGNETDKSVPDWVAAQRQQAAGNQPLTVVLGSGGATPNYASGDVQSVQPNTGGQLNEQPNAQPNVQPNAQSSVQPTVHSNVQPTGVGRPQPTTDAASNDMPSIANVHGITESVQGYATNMDALNNNIQALNNVYEMQLKSIQNQVDTIKFTNDSLERIKRLYDGAVNDGFAFRDESEKMTKNIEALNRVYARLLQAMTATQSNPYNNNNNNPSSEGRY